MKISFKMIVLSTMLLVTGGVSQLFAEMMPIEPGTVRSTTSPNGTFQLRVSYDSHGGTSFSLSKGDTKLWSNSLSEHPGKVAISDNGQTVAVTTFGWEDEGGASGMNIYNEKGKVVKQVDFSHGGMSTEGLKWVALLEVSSDGKYIALGQDGRENAMITIYDAQTGLELLSQKAGYERCAGVAIAPNVERTLLATRNYASSGMVFVLLDKTGNILGSKTIDKNFSYDVPVYVKFQENGSPEIFDLKSGKFITGSFAIPLTGKVK